MIQISKGWLGQLQSSETNIVKGLIIEHHALVSVLNELMEGKGGIIRLKNHVGHFGGWDNGEGGHNSIRVLLADFLDDQISKARPSASTKRMRYLEALQTICALSFLSDYVHGFIDDLGTLSVVALRPAISSSVLTKDHIIWAKEPAHRTRSDRVNHSRFKVHKDSSGHIATTHRFVIVDVDSLELEVGVAAVLTVGIDTVLV